MSFIWKSLLGWLLLAPLLVLLYINLQGQREALAAQSGLSMQTVSRMTGWRRHLPAALFLLGFTLLLFSFSRPQAMVTLPKYEGTVLLVFDVSGSMAADDILPTRMETAKSIASDFVGVQPSDVRIGVVAFSDGGLNVQPPGVNRKTTLATIERLVPRRGTSLGNGMLVALNTIVIEAGDPPILDNASVASSNASELPASQGWYPSAVIVLLSDGENNDNNPNPLQVADLAMSLGVRIYTVGVGSKAGAIIKVEGMNIHTQLNESLLKQVAETAVGRYYFAGDPTELHKIYDDLEPTLSVRSEQLELTSLLAGLSLVFFLVGGILSLLWFGRVV